MFTYFEKSRHSFQDSVFNIFIILEPLHRSEIKLLWKEKMEKWAKLEILVKLKVLFPMGQDNVSQFIVLPIKSFDMTNYTIKYNNDVSESVLFSTFSNVVIVVIVI